MGLRRGLKELKGKLGQLFHQNPDDEPVESPGASSSDVQQVATPLWAAGWASTRDVDFGRASGSGLDYEHPGHLPGLQGLQGLPGHLPHLAGLGDGRYRGPEPDGEPPYLPPDSSDGEDEGPFGTAQRLPTASFTSTGTRDRAGPTSSFGSTATDFDYLTSPGAQAEHNPDYIRQVMASQFALPEMGGLANPQASSYWGASPWGQFPASVGAPYPGYSAGGLPASDDAAMAAEIHQQRAAEFYRLATEHMMAAAAARAEAAANAPPPVVGSAPEPAAPSSDFWSAQFGGPPAWPISGGPGTLGARGPRGGKSSGRAGPSAARIGVGPVEESQRTTVMLRNLPNDYTRDMLVQLLEAEGFKGHFNFIYLPIDFKHKAGLGYAFVNMETHEDAKQVWEHFKGFSNWRMASQKVCEVAWGEPLQGLAQHIERYRNSPVMHKDVPDEYKPLVFVRGVRAPFPAPTRRLKPPRVKCSGTAESMTAEGAGSGDDGVKGMDPAQAGW